MKKMSSKATYFGETDVKSAISNKRAISVFHWSFSLTLWGGEGAPVKDGPFEHASKMEFQQFHYTKYTGNIMQLREYLGLFSIPGDEAGSF